MNLQYLTRPVSRICLGAVLLALACCRQIPPQTGTAESGRTGMNTPVSRTAREQMETPESPDSPESAETSRRQNAGRSRNGGARTRAVSATRTARASRTAGTGAAASRTAAETARTAAAPASAGKSGGAPRKGTGASPPAASPFRADLLWSGAWERDGNLANRMDLRLSAWGFTGRSQLLDRRYSPFREQWQENWKAQTPAFSGGLYHRNTGSRFLYGVLEEWGLSARLKNTWAKSLAYPAARKPLGADLKTEYSATGTNETYGYLSAGRLGGSAFSVAPYVSLWIEDDTTPAFGAGLDTQIAKVGLRLEGFYTRKTLPPKTISTWFSETPPLPERDAELYGAGLLFSSPWFSLAADGALSRVFGRGEDYYGSLAVSLGKKPWLLSMGVEAAGEKFSDREGSSIGAGLRAGARFEWKQSRSGLFRFDTVLRAPAPEAPFNRSAVSLYYRFPARPKSAGFSLLQPGRISVAAARDGRNTAKILDSADAAVSWRVGPVNLGFYGSIDGYATGGEDPAAQSFSPFPRPSGHDFNAAKAAGELSWSPGMFQFRVKTGRVWTRKKDPVQDAAFTASINGARGRFSIKISSPDFPEEWTGQISWRLNL